MFKYSIKLFLTFLASTVVSFISMSLFLSAEIDFLYKVLLGILFIVFTLLLTWNCSYIKGNEDFKKKTNNKLNGFFAGVIAMIPAIIIEVIFIIIAFGAWKKGNSTLYASLYYILYFVFLCYSPLLSVFVSFNPVLGVDFAQLSIAYLKDITVPNAVPAPMFIIPIIVFVLVSGIAYIFGCNQQIKIKEAIKNITKK